MTDEIPAGSRDDNPPLLLHPGNYEFLAVGRADGDLIYLSSQSGITSAGIVTRLRNIANRMEGGQ